VFLCGLTGVSGADGAAAIESAAAQRRSLDGGRDQMEMLQLVAVTGLYAGILAVVGIGQGTNDAEVIAGIEQQIAKAWVERDRSTIDAILAPEWSVTDASGQVLTKEQVLRETFASTDRRIDSMAIDDVHVRLFGDVAVATGRTRASGSYRGTSSSVVLRFTDVFVRRDGRWRAVASHGSIVAQ